MRSSNKKLLIISFDALNDSVFERLLQYDTFAALAKQSVVHRNVSTVFLSNTYPVHTSVATGVTPGIHGVISNTEPFPAKNPVWITNEAAIKVKTIWQAAAEKGIDTAAVLWPVTGYSKTIKYNMPEAHTLPGKNQILTNLASGSKLMQIKMFMRHRKLMNGLEQPFLDNFATACMVDILREYSPGLALMHLTAYDSFCHKNGRDSGELETAFKSLDDNLKALLKAAKDNYDIILFSDHGQLNVHTIVEPNKILKSLRLSRESGCFFECCAGSAFFHKGSLKPEVIRKVRAKLERSEGFRRFLTKAEMTECGHQKEAFGFCAKEGYCYEAFASDDKANHGYPLDMPDYKVFYMVRSEKYTPVCVAEGGSLLDITPLAAKLLGIKL